MCLFLKYTDISIIYVKEIRQVQIHSIGRDSIFH